MPTDPANRETTRPASRGIGGRVITMALFVFVGLYIFSDIRGEIGRWKMAVARDQHQREQYEQALETADEARQWDPDNLAVALPRIHWLVAKGQDEAAMAGLTELLEAVEGQRQSEIIVLLERAEQLQFMDRHQEAIADASKAVEYEKAFRRPRGDEYWNAQVMNARAYVVARAAAAGRASDEQKGTAIVQMQEVMQFVHEHRYALRAGSDAIEARMKYQIMELMFLDSYAYLRLFAGEHYRSAVLRDFTRCVEALDQLNALANVLAGDNSRSRALYDIVKDLEKHKAVILHHRGETYALLGNKRAAREDKDLAIELGYGKQNGNW